METEREEWKPIPRWPNHEASNRGRVRRRLTSFLLPGHVLRQYEQNTGYLAVQSLVSVHALVAEAFYGVRGARFVVNHKDGNKSNNRPENLEYVTRSENNAHAFATGLSARGERMPMAKLTDEQVIEIRRGYQGRWGEQTRLAEEYGVSQGLISQIIRGDIWRHIGTEGRHTAVSHNRAPGRPRLSAVQVSEIRRRLAAGSESQADIARFFGVPSAVVSDIATGRKWKPKNHRRSGALGQHASDLYKVRRGERHAFAKLTEQQVREIREKHTGKRGQQAQLAREYGVSQQLVSLVVHGKRWKHVQ